MVNSLLARKNRAGPIRISGIKLAQGRRQPRALQAIRIQKTKGLDDSVLDRCFDNCLKPVRREIGPASQSAVINKIVAGGINHHDPAPAVIAAATASGLAMTRWERRLARAAAHATIGKANNRARVVDGDMSIVIKPAMTTRPRSGAWAIASPPVAARR